MSSELAKHSPLLEKKWLAHKVKIGKAMNEARDSWLVKLRDIIPDIIAIRDGKLWSYGKYSSFKEFVIVILGVTPQAVYKAIANDESMRNALEMSKTESIKLTLEDGDHAPKEDQKQQPKQTNNPPAKSKGRKPKTEPEPQEAAFTDIPPANTLAGTAPTQEEIAEQDLPPAAVLQQQAPAPGMVEYQLTEFIPCPHCHGAGQIPKP